MKKSLHIIKFKIYNIQQYLKVITILQTTSSNPKFNPILNFKI